MRDTLDASFELKKYQILCGLKIIEKNQILFKKERSFQKVERKRQENLVTELRAQMVGLSEGQSCESFQIIKLSFVSCEMIFLREKQIQNLKFKSCNTKHKSKVLVSSFEKLGVVLMHADNLSCTLQYKLPKQGFLHYRVWERKLISISS